MNDPESRLDLVQHIREQIARDAQSYANAAKLRCVAGRLVFDLTGGSDNATVLDHEEAKPSDDPSI